MKKYFKFNIAAASIAMTVASSSSFAQFEKPEDAVKYRQSVFSVMGYHFGRLGAMVNEKRTFDAKLAISDADVVAFLASQPFHAFVAGTTSPKAKPEIWKKADDFKMAAEKMQQEAIKLATAAKSSDLSIIKAAFGSTAKTCKSCHDQFKKD